MLENLYVNAYSAAAYAGVGVVLMGVSFIVIDLLTPGKLREVVWTQRNRNAGILVASNLAAVAIIVASAIVASEGRLGTGLIYTIVYSVIGIAIMAAAFLVMDALTPGKLGELLLHPEPHPAAWVHAIMHIGVAVIVAVSIL